MDIAFSIAEQDLFVKFVQDCHNSRSEADFTKLIASNLGGQFSYNGFVCGYGTMTDQSVCQVINFSFPDRYIRHVIAGDKKLRSPVGDLWKKTKRPVFLDATSMNCQDKMWLSVCHESGIESIAAHGVVDCFGRTTSYFAFSNCDGDREGVDVGVLDFLIPHLQVALQNSQNGPQTSLENCLSDRECEVLRWTCLGKSNWEIGLVLGISSMTVKVHMRNIMRKLSASTRGHAAAIALSRGIIEI
jgi:DNA-binding CsgD family transcriptional regulator